MSLTEKGRSPGRARGRISKEFRADALALERGRSVAHVVRDLGIGESNLGRWVRQARIDRGKGPGLTT